MQQNSQGLSVSGIGFASQGRMRCGIELVFCCFKPGAANCYPSHHAPPRPAPPHRTPPHPTAPRPALPHPSQRSRFVFSGGEPRVPRVNVYIYIYIYLYIYIYTYITYLPREAVAEVSKHKGPIGRRCVDFNWFKSQLMSDSNELRVK